MLRKKRTKNYNIKISIAGVINRINSGINRANFFCLEEVFFGVEVLWFLVEWLTLEDKKHSGESP